MDKAELESKHIAELHALAAEAGVPGYRMLRRDELVGKLADGKPAKGERPERRERPQRQERPPRQERPQQRRRRERPAREESSREPSPPAEPPAPQSSA